MTGTCTGCGLYQSGDPSGKCWECRIAEPGYRARLDGTVRKGIAAEYAAHPEWRQLRPESGDPGPYRFFWAEVIRKECPECGWATAVGFDHPDDRGAETGDPTKCTECSARDIEAGLRAESEARNTYEVPDALEPQTQITTGPASPGPEVTEPTQPEMELSA